MTDTDRAELDARAMVAAIASGDDEGACLVAAMSPDPVLLALALAVHAAHRPEVAS